MQLPHFTAETPMFMPVGTKGSPRSLMEQVPGNIATPCWRRQPGNAHPAAMPTTTLMQHMSRRSHAQRSGTHHQHHAQQPVLKSHCRTSPHIPLHGTAPPHPSLRLAPLQAR
jgi:hypothetical protein